MRIGIDARFYGSIGKGLGRYTSELIAHLETIDAENDYVVFLRRSNFGEYVPRNPRFTKVLAEFPWYGWREQLLYPFWLRKFRLDLMHFTHFNVPYLYRRPFVVTVHDLILLRFPTTRATTLGPLLYRLKYAAYRLVIGRAIADAQAVLAVSLYTKNDIIGRFPSAKQKTIVVTHLACASSVAAGARAEPLRTDVHAPFALYVGNAYPHKNLDRLLDAFALFRKLFPDHSLVLVGAPDHFYERLRREARAKGHDAGVIFYGHARDSELAALYRAASFYVFPSLYEGFGLPPLEAMCHGLPVASSNATCMPEVLGDAARWFDPHTTETIAGAMTEIASHEALRQELIAKGKERIKAFDWTTTATRTLETYRAALPPHA